MPKNTEPKLKLAGENPATKTNCSSELKMLYNWSYFA
jgi:hypothetical protein